MQIKELEKLKELPKYQREISLVAFGVAIIAVNFLLIGGLIPLLFPILNIAGALIIVVPPFWVFYTGYKTKKDIEMQFIFFITDLTDSINAGMTLPLALEHCSNRNYSSLSNLINEMAAQVDWGIPFENVLMTFSKKVGSITVKRSTSTIIETYKIGGKISDSLNAVRKSLVTIDKIRSERAAAVHSQVVTGYLIFFIFIFIIVILHSFLIPVVTQQISGITITPTGDPLTEGIPVEELSQIFSIFIVVQGFFAGIATGKMSDGSLVAGLKHSVLLIVIGYTVFSVASQFPITLIEPEQLVLP